MLRCKMCFPQELAAWEMLALSPFFFLKNNFVFKIIFGCAGTLRLQGLFSSCGAQASHAVASLVAGHGLQGTQALVVTAPGLKSTEAVVVAHRLCCSVACGIFLDQGLNPCLLH